MKEKIVLITGSSRGIGASIAKKFARDGSIIIVHHYIDDSNAKKVLEKIQKYNEKIYDQIGLILNPPSTTKVWPVT